LAHDVDSAQLHKNSVVYNSERLFDKLSDYQLLENDCAVSAP
jgi:hypothetical protein